MSGPHAIGTIVAASVLGVGVPWLAIRMVVPSLVDSEKAQATNFAGRTVVYGLGIVWLVWAGCAIIGGAAAANVEGARVLGVLALAGALALVAFALGVVDDAYGTSTARGFKGHLKALFGGRLTTGGLKLIGLGTACLVASIAVAQVAPWGTGGPARPTPAWPVLALVAGAAIALTSNFVNLTDLRPGRALKAYSVLALAGAILCPVGLATLSGLPLEPAEITVSVVALVLFTLGPVVSTWRFDLGEVGMLGDAGANPMGAVAGLLIVVGLPVPALLGYFVLMLALNLASEKVSFSRVIESNRALAWLDGLGRLSHPDDARGKSKEGPLQETNHE